MAGADNPAGKTEDNLTGKTAGKIAGKTAIVTGATGGIGGAIARLLAEEGAAVYFCDLDKEAGEAAAKSSGGRFLMLDVTNEAAWESALKTVADESGGLDILINNAGVTTELTPLESTSYAEWRHVIAVNLDGVFLGTKHAILAMKERGGAIINISSIYGIVGESMIGAYGASKGGVRILTKSAAMECAHFGYPIRINSVHPGYIDAGMFKAVADMQGGERLRRRGREKTPMRRLGAPEEIARGVLYLASKDSSFTTGAELVIDGGYTAR